MNCWVIGIVLTVTVIGAVLTEDVLVRAERGARRQSKKAGCKYHKKSVNSECDPVTKTYNKTFQLKKARGGNCDATMVITKPCKNGNAPSNCRYKNNGPWSACDPTTNLKSKTKILKVRPGRSTADCAPTLLKTKPCNGGRKIGKARACKYNKSDWSECDPATNYRKRVLTLKKGDTDICEGRKTVLMKCGKECKYEKGPWSTCNAENRIERTLTLKKGDPTQCEVTKKKSIPCRRRAALTGLSCKYSLGDWGDCNPRTMTMTRKLTLKAGNVEMCPKTKVLSRKCKNRCKFVKGEWTACDMTTNLMTRVDKLANADKPNSFCEKQRTITKKCEKKKKCKYELGDWSECDSATQMRSRSKKLVKGDPKVCKPETTLKRSCLRANGQPRCFFGPWGEFGKCMNGVMTKNRRVLQGGTACERKAVITKGCS